MYLHTIKQISEKIRIRDQRIYMGVVDILKAFDSVPRKQIWQSLRKRGIKMKLGNNIKAIGDGFGNQSYLMIHLLTLANLLVQFRHKNNASSFSQYIYNNETTYLLKCMCCFMNLTMFLRYNKMCVTFLTELDDGRYVNVLKLSEGTIDT